MRPQARPDPCQERELSTTHTWTVIDKRRNRKLAVAITGKRGLPFVWGHALQCSMQADEASTIFDWPGLAATAQLIRYDARAHGESCDEHDPQACRWESLARDMWRVAEDCGANTAVLGGASMGCATALHAAMQHPERVLGLVLVIPPTAWELRPRQARAYRIMARVVRFTGRLPFRLAAMHARQGHARHPAAGNGARGGARTRNAGSAQCRGRVQRSRFV